MTLAIIRKIGGWEGRLDNYPQKIHLECRMAKKRWVEGLDEVGKVG